MTIMKKGLRAFLAAATAALAALPARAEDGGTIAFVGADVLTMTEAGRVEDAVLVVRDGIVASIGRAGSTPPAGARVIDVSVMTIAPGLVDMHAHLPPLPGEEGDAAWRALALYAANGVTTLRSMAGNEAHLALREKTRSGDLFGPRIIAAAPAISFKTAATPGAARQAVEAAAGTGYDLVKLHHIEDPSVYDAAVEAAKAAGLPIAGHVTNAVGLDRALAAGQQVEHLDGYLHALLPEGSPLKESGFGQIPPAADLDALDWDRLPGVVDATVKAGVANVPTLALFEEIADTGTPTDERLARPAMAYVAPGALKAWAAQQDQLAASGMLDGVAVPFVEARRRITRALHDAGARIMAGADAPQAFMAPGFSLHEELSALVAAGLSPAEALRAATSEPAAYFEEAGYDGVRAGRLEEGSPADLVLLSADPERAIEAASQIEGVMIAGRWADRAALDRTLEAVRASVTGTRADGPAAPVFLVRHAEAGSRGDDPRLTRKGRRRAKALAEQLADVPFGAIYTTDYRRTRMTAAPLAEALGIEPRLYDPRDLPGLARKLAEAEAPVIVFGHSNTTPQLVELLGGDGGAPIAHDEHDRLYWLDEGRTRMLEVGGDAPLLLGACEAPGLPAGARCGTLPVAEGGRDARTIGLQVAMLQADGGDDSPPLAVLPGGPGLGGVQIAGGVRQMLGEVAAGRDILLVDQRGTGGSNPLACDEAGQSLGEALTQLAAPDTDAVRACREELETRADLTRYTTSLAAKDLDAVRRALGIEVLDLYGMSYGTRLALENMRLHPEGVGVAVLRAAAPPSMMLPFWTPRDAQESLEGVLAACAAQAPCARAYPDLEGDVERVLARLAQGPVTVTVTDPRNGQSEEVAFSKEAFGTSLFFLLYIPELYAHLPRLVHEAADGDYRPLVQTISPIVASTLGQVASGLRLSVICAEDASQIDRRKIAEATEGTFFGDGPIASDLAACEAWSTARVERGFFAPVEAEHPSLVISGSVDPVAGPRWGELVTESLPNAVHVTVEGASHYPPLPGCTGRLAKQLLEERSVDGLDTSCAEEPITPTFALPKGAEAAQ